MQLWFGSASLADHRLRDHRVFSDGLVVLCLVRWISFSQLYNRQRASVGGGDGGCSGRSLPSAIRGKENMGEKVRRTPEDFFLGKTRVRQSPLALNPYPLFEVA